MLAAFFFAVGGLPLILLIDLASFAFAFCVLLFFITIPKQVQEKTYSAFDIFSFGTSCPVATADAGC